MAHSNDFQIRANSQTQVVNVGPYSIGGSEFAVIAGPCSIESESQFLETAEAVKSHGACLLRGGIWKMRTSAKAFQGLGPSAFELIQRVLKKTEMMLVAEVTDPRQIEELDGVVSMFQVGSRNMHNYSLLKELGQSKKPVLLKRGFAALVDEWIKAAEYVTTHGNPNVILCERGIRTFNSNLRYTLDLATAVQARSLTHLPVIIDPSHATGRPELVSPLACAALAAGLDGVMFEFHPHPQSALSDGPQALHLDQLDDLTQRLSRLAEALGRDMEPVANDRPQA